MINEIKKLKKEKNAIVLAHYYVEDAVQEAADYVGDSYFLSKIANESSADIIVFCGVRFMGESAKILSPEKKVLMPDITADCPMAHMTTVENISKIRSSYEDLAIACYINSTPEIKMYSDVVVTSSNAVEIIEKLPEKNIYFIPDSNLARYVASQVRGKNIIIGEGYCPVHDIISLDALKKTRFDHPQALFLAHPECRMEILNEADYVGSTSGIIDFATKSDKNEFIIGTEIGIFYELKAKNPNKKFYPASSSQVCFDMKKVTLEKLLRVLRDESEEIHVSDEVRERALKSLDRMLELGK